MGELLFAALIVGAAFCLAGECGCGCARDW